MRKNIMQQKQINGFTLVELMVVIAIVAILLAIAVPSFASYIKRNNVEALQAKLSTAIATARSEAASRNVVVSVCASNQAGTNCANNKLWTGVAGADSGFGWIVFEDVNGNGAIDLGGARADLIIDVFNSTSTYAVTSNVASGGVVGADVLSLSFSSQGFLVNNGAETIFTVCEPAGDVFYAKGLYVLPSGLMMKTEDLASDNDATHNIPGGANLACP